MSTQPSASAVARALRRIRAGAYRLEEREQATVLALALEVSIAGRRNAANQIVQALARAGFELDHADPVDALARTGATLVVCSRG